MATEWLYGVSQWVTYPVSFAIMLAALEIGRRLGSRRRAEDAATSGKAQAATFEAALLGLVSLMIGFTFSVALLRYEARKAVVLEEANAIGTATLRTTLLPAPHAAHAANLFRDYVDSRIGLAEAGVDAAKRDEAVQRSLRLQGELWREADAVMADDPHSLAGSLFVQALNDVIDVHTKRMAAFSNHVPEVAFIMLYGLAFVAIGVAGYSAGLSGVRDRLVTTVTALSVATVITLIVDLDRPYRGLVTVDESPILGLKGRGQ